MILLENTRLIVTTPQVVWRALRRWFRRIDRLQRNQEHGFVLILDARNRVTVVDVIGLGTLNSVMIHPREVYRRAITHSAASIVVAHNHPSGDCTPSDADVLATQRLVQAGHVVGIELVDHIIFSWRGFYSFREQNRISPQGWERY